MKITFASVLAMSATFLTTEAPWSCRCENTNNVKTGINEICSQLDNNWTSRSCAAGLYYGCRECTYDPSGDYDEANHSRLREWCADKIYSDREPPKTGYEISCYKI